MRVANVCIVFHGNPLRQSDILVWTNVEDELANKLRAAMCNVSTRRLKENYLPSIFIIECPAFAQQCWDRLQPATFNRISVRKRMDGAIAVLFHQQQHTSFQAG